MAVCAGKIEQKGGASRWHIVGGFFALEISEFPGAPIKSLKRTLSRG